MSMESDAIASDSMMCMSAPNQPHLQCQGDADGVEA